MTTTEVKTSIGTFELKKPNAGARNKALIKAETDSGKMKQSIFFMEILPKCIIRRPENCDKDVPIEQILDSMEMEDYDLLVDGMGEIIDGANKDVEQKKTP